MVQGIILKSLRDLNEAPPSKSIFYISKSGTPTYFPIKGLIEENLAILRGEFFNEDGEHVITVELTSLPPSSSADGMLSGFGSFGAGEEESQVRRRTITIGREFFVTALKDYQEWKIKWWREAIQNSVDAGSYLIQLGSVRSNETKEVMVFCDDDGGGMDEDTILNKFLVLGGTTKLVSGNTAGGFGKAKELLLLPWISWRIHSRDTIVEGAGIDYTVTKTNDFKKGTRLEVVMPADQNTTSVEAIAFVEKCFLPDCRFTVDGNRIKANLQGKDLVQNIQGKADVWYKPLKKPEKQSYIYVRTKGLYMFSKYVGQVPGYILAELTAPSVEILTANRDGFRDWELSSAIDSLAERIAKDNMSALRGKNRLIRKKYEGTGTFKAKARAASLMEQIGPSVTKLSDSSTENILTQLDNYSRSQEESLTSPISSLPSTVVATAMLDQKFLGAAHIEAALKQLVWEPDFYLMNDIETFKVPSKFFPETMTPRVLKLIKSWVELCRFVLMQLGSDSKFGVGFIFSESTAAAALVEDNRHGEEEFWLMINPFKDLGEREEVWSPSQDSDLKWLYAAAIHECTHVANGIQYHDESFAAALTYNMAKCADGYRKIKQIVGGIRARGSAMADED